MEAWSSHVLNEINSRYVHGLAAAVYSYNPVVGSSPSRGILNSATEVDSCYVIPADAGIQAVLDRELKTNLDAGVRRHDELSLHLRTRGFERFTRLTT
jgi:hypothetical protein